MTNYNERLDEILAKLHQQYEMQFGMHKQQFNNKKIKQAITSLMKELVDEVIGEDESSGIFPGIGESSTMRDDLRADQRTHLQSIFKREFEEV